MERIRKSEMPKVVITVGKRIQSIIEKKHLRKRDVAHDAGLDVENLRKYINGTQEMKIGTLVKIAEALQVSVSELLSS